MECEMADSEKSDHLHGWKAIADHLGLKPDAARHLAKSSGLPAYKLPGNKTIRARRSRLNTVDADSSSSNHTVGNGVPPTSLTVTEPTQLVIVGACRINE